MSANGRRRTEPPESVEIETVETHTAGQACRIVVDGVDVDDLTREATRGAGGGTGRLEEVRDAFDDRYGWLREFLLHEPRGHPNLVASVPVESEVADVGMLFFDGDEYIDNCGDGLIGTTAALMKTGRLDRRERVSIETAEGVIDARVTFEDGTVDRVAVQGLRSFLGDTVSVTVDTTEDERLDDDEVPVSGTVANGAGVWCVLVDAEQLDIRVDGAADLDRIVDYGMQVKTAVNDRHEVDHPLTGESGRVYYTMFYDESADPDRNVVVYGAGSIDRSPCGTGTMAKLALLHSRGEIDVDEEYPHESIIGTRYVGRVLDVGEHDGVTVTECELGGWGYVISEGTFVREPEDDLLGFRL